MTNQIPCHNCITLAICKARILSGGDKREQHQNVLQTVYTVCPLARDYVRTDEAEWSYIRIDEMEQYMREPHES